MKINIKEKSYEERPRMTSTNASSVFRAAGGGEGERDEDGKGPVTGTVPGP